VKYSWCCSYRPLQLLHYTAKNDQNVVFRLGETRAETSTSEQHRSKVLEWFQQAEFRVGAMFFVAAIGDTGSSRTFSRDCREQGRRKTGRDKAKATF
jgi:hypothetical protein